MLNPEIIGRYALYEKIASGGMATVHIGRLLGPVGFSRTVAIKRMHPQFTGDPEFVSMFLDEARLAARVRHPNVVSTLDVVATNGELFLVLEYVQGETLSSLCRRVNARDERVSIPIAAAIVSGLLHGLHAAHEAKNERGEPLGIVHRDVSPQNVMVGTDGVARVLDFGVAKAAGRLQTTHGGTLKGKISYMPHEQLMGERVTRRCDVYAASVVLWETLAGRRLFGGENEGAILQNVLNLKVGPPSLERPDVPPELDAVVLRGLARNPDERYATAREMATALEAAVHVAIVPAVGAWVDQIAAEAISEQTERLAEIEHASDPSREEAWHDPLRGSNRDRGSTAGVEGAPRLDRAAAAASSGSVQGSMRIDVSHVSQVSALSVPRIAGLEPTSTFRRNAVLSLSVALIAVTLTAFAMRGRAPAASAPAGAAAASAPQTSSTAPSASAVVSASSTPASNPPGRAAAEERQAPTVDTATSGESTPSDRSAVKPASKPRARPPSPATASSSSGRAYNPFEHL